MFVLAFSSISASADYGVSLDMGLDIISKAVREFLSFPQTTEHDIHLIYVETSCSAFQNNSQWTKLEAIQCDVDARFTVLSKDEATLVTLKSSGHCPNAKLNGIVNSANHRLSPRGGLVNQMIHDAVGSELFEKSVKLYPNVGVGYKAPLVFAVPLSESNPLHVKEGVDVVIQAVSVNLNPSKPYCEESEDAAAAALLETYRAIFKQFLRYVIARDAPDTECDNSSSNHSISNDNNDGREQHAHVVHSNIGANKGSVITDYFPPSKSDSTDNAHAGDKRNSNGDKHNHIDHTSSTNDNHAVSAHVKKSAATTHKIIATHNGGFDKNLLYSYLRHPEQHEESIYLRNEYCTVIHDAYPKARAHLLVLPHEDFLPSVTEVRQLTPQHRGQVRQLHEIARQVAAEFDKKDTSSKSAANDGVTGASSSSSSSGFLIGYHSIPSLYPLHIHVISRDLISDSLKTKKHWNSFTTDYFVPADRVEAWLDRGLSVDSQLPSEHELHELLKAPLKCHKCDAAAKTVPALKQHLTVAHVTR